MNRSICSIDPKADEPKNKLSVEAFEPRPEVIADVERIMEAAGIELGGVEYMIDDRDGRRLYYDINALSNFVADGERVVGFDPFVKLADWLERKPRRSAPAEETRHGELERRDDGGSADAVWVLAARVWRVAAQRRRRRDGDQLGVCTAAGAARRADRAIDLTLIAELNLNDIKGVEAPSLDAWSTAAALAAVTRSWS